MRHNHLVCNGTKCMAVMFRVNRLTRSHLQIRPRNCTGEPRKRNVHLRPLARVYPAQYSGTLHEFLSVPLENLSLIMEMKNIQILVACLPKR